MVQFSQNWGLGGGSISAELDLITGAYTVAHKYGGRIVLNGTSTKILKTDKDNLLSSN
jgi:hypothetical protein